MRWLDALGETCDKASDGSRVASQAICGTTRASDRDRSVSSPDGGIRYWCGSVGHLCLSGTIETVAAGEISLAISEEDGSRAELEQMPRKFRGGGQNKPCSQPFFSG